MFKQDISGPQAMPLELEVLEILFDYGIFA